ncbi:MAG TPA: DUF5123 domain-containing protein [Bacteroidales bacterium]|nr:DUF5123 domain-containing protein [Bacteroidales bacterium]
MKTLTKIFKMAFFIAVTSLIASSCEDNLPEEITEISVSRLFSPAGIEVRVVQKTSVRLNWNPVRNAVSYTVEFHENEQLDFSGTPVRILSGVTNEQLPITVGGFGGDTGYSVRVKAIGEGIDPSKWVTATFRTEPEQILFPIDPEELLATQVTLRWPAGEIATDIVLTPGDIIRPVTAQEVQSGIAIVSGLQSETSYTARLMNGNKVRGTTTFTTPIDLGGATAVHPTDNLAAIVSAAAPGTVLALFPGEYTVFMGDIIIDRSITIRGLRPHNKPVIFNRFLLRPGVTDIDIAFIDLEMVGDRFIPPDSPLPGQLQAFQFDAGTHTVNNFLVSGLVVRNYFRSFIASGSAPIVRVNNLTIENTIVTDVFCSGGDFIDFRIAHVPNLTIRNSTFDMVATGMRPPNVTSAPRVFIRLDADAGARWTGSTSRVIIENNTFFNVSHNPATPTTAGTRIIDIRFVPNVSTIRNNMFVGASPDYTAHFSERVETAEPTFANNNYFNAPRFLAGVPTGSPKYDTSPTRSTLNPGFVNADAGNFTVTQEDLIFRRVGDPRWLP